MDINSKASSVGPTSQKLEETLFTVISGINDPENHYMINANYYECEGRKVYMAAIYLHKDACWNLELDTEALCCEVLLNRSDPDKKYMITLPYTEIWKISANKGEPFFTDQNQLFFDYSTLARLKYR